MSCVDMACTLLLPVPQTYSRHTACRQHYRVSAEEPTQLIFDDEPPEDIAPRHAARHCARANMFVSRNPTTSARLFVGLRPMPTGTGRGVAALDCWTMPC